MKPADLLPMELGEEDPVLDAAAQLEQAARNLDLEDWIVQRLKHPEREIAVHLLLRRDCGETLACTGLRVQHDRPGAGCMGAVLLSSDATLQQLRALALQMTLQCALLDLPLGGSAGAIVCDAAQLTERELRHLVRRYLAALDTRADVFAPMDFIAAWTAAGRHLGPSGLVGKPAILDGVPDLAAAIAAGWFALLSETFAQPARSQQPAIGTPMSRCRVAIQGFSPAVAALAHLLAGSGARVIALADKSGGLLAERGLDLDAVSAHVAAHAMLYGYDGAEAVSNAEVLESACDVLLTAAAERQISAYNAGRIRAPLVLEGIPNAVTPAAASAMSSRGISVIPALLGTAARTLAWFTEWQHGLRHAAPDQAATAAFLRDRLAARLRAAMASAATRKDSLPAACRRLALEKLSARWRLTA